jgi:RNA polymerase sigma-70 factor, ECF subfamily
MTLSSTEAPEAPPQQLARARDQFLALVAEVRPELHRYAARLTGSIVDGEDVVQETLAKAFYALSMKNEVPPLRPWLFHIAHNTAIDFLRRAGRDHASLDEVAETDVAEPAPDPAAARAALGAFLALPLRQRSAVILKDVLGHSLEEVAQAMDTTVLAVKAALVRGRAALRAHVDRAAPIASSPEERALLERYVSLFNARDFTGLAAMLAEDVRLDHVSQASRHGRQVAGYFGRYAQHLEIRGQLGTVDGRDAILIFEGAAAAPAYFILIEWRDGKVALIRDYRYVPYAAREL